jgi:hypothetical protein
MKHLWLFLLPLVIACSGERQETALLPDRIHGIALGKSTTGKEASELIARLHAKSVAPVASEIGYYGAFDPPLTLYVSRFASAEEAQDQMDLMAKTIGPGSSGFAHHRVEQMAGTDVHYVVGYGQAHYFFVDREKVLWLAAPVDVARPAALELIGEGRRQ